MCMNRKVHAGAYEGNWKWGHKIFWAPHFSFGPHPRFGGWAPFSFAGNDPAVEMSGKCSFVTCKCFAVGRWKWKWSRRQVKVLWHWQSTSVPRWWWKCGTANCRCSGGGLDIWCKTMLQTDTLHKITKQISKVLSRILRCLGYFYLYRASVLLWYASPVLARIGMSVRPSVRHTLALSENDTS